MNESPFLHPYIGYKSYYLNPKKKGIYLKIVGGLSWFFHQKFLEKVKFTRGNFLWEDVCAQYGHRQPDYQARRKYCWVCVDVHNSVCMTIFGDTARSYI